MPWQEASTMSLRQEFVAMAQQEGANVRALCRRYQISPPTAYKWLARARAGDTTLADRSRRPHTAPARTAPALEAAVLAERDAHPAWGARKLRARLAATTPALAPAVPAVSTVHAILRRHGRIDPARVAAHTAYQRFEHPAPNQLWQMDFKGHVALSAGRLHPLTILDDHSRFAVGLFACGDEQGDTVRSHLTRVFRRYGLPERILCDNGSPWGVPGAAAGAAHTPLSVWLLRLGVGVSHGRPYHPQTQGKEERFHRTLKAEALTQPFADLAAAQAHFDTWRDCYNRERPHQALASAVPASRYRPSQRSFPVVLPPIEYGPDDLVRTVQDKGRIHLHGRTYLVGRAFRGEPVALRPTAQDHIREVYYCHQRITTLDLTQPHDRPSRC
jgi:transposase InsO family protein